MNTRQTVFVLEYLQCWNASEAARRAGYSEKTAGSIGEENLKKPEIAAAIKRRITDKAVKADQVLLLLGDHARGSMADFITIETNGAWAFDFLKAQALGRLHLIKAIKTTRYGTELELYDAQSALEKLGKALGVLANAAPQDVINWTPEQWQAERERRQREVAETEAVLEDDGA